MVYRALKGLPVLIQGASDSGYNEPGDVADMLSRLGLNTAHTESLYRCNGRAPYMAEIDYYKDYRA